MNFEEYCASVGVTPAPLKDRELSPTSVALRDRLAIKLMAVEHMGGKCFVCGYCKCARALDFHHRKNVKKSFSVANYTNYVYRDGFDSVWSAVKNELKKCIMLCANCHREVEAGMLEVPSGA